MGVRIKEFFFENCFLTNNYIKINFCVEKTADVLYNYSYQDLIPTANVKLDFIKRSD